MQLLQYYVVSFYPYTKYDVCQFPFSKLHEHACPYCFYCWYEGLFTNYGDVLKFIAVPSFKCVDFFFVHGK